MVVNGVSASVSSTNTEDCFNKYFNFDIYVFVNSCMYRLCNSICNSIKFCKDLHLFN